MADNFETVRRHARALRETVSADAADTGRALVLQALAKQKYELHLLPPDDPLLSGTDGVLDRDNCYVYVRQDLSDLQITAVTAHELGHLELHSPDEVCQSPTPDISAPEQAAPIGLDSVEGYGARERRELQANVFAREYLLPREVVRRAFIEESTAATDLAKRLEIPLTVAYQQYADSLLLPEAPLPPPRKKLTLDESQQAVAEHSGCPLLVEAGPGTGKTTALVGRVVHLVDKCAVAPSNILALTYSNKAARELSERVSEELPSAAIELWSGTFHAFGLELIRKYHQLFGLGSGVALMAQSDAIELLEDELPTLGLTHYHMLYEPAFMLKDILGAISRAKDELVDPDTYLSLATAALNSASDEKEQKSAERSVEIANVYRIYQEKLKAMDRVDFGDLIMRPTLLLESQPSLRQTVAQNYQHVLVDEYQDVNRASVRLLKALCGTGERLWAVGDARQSVYRFRGASPANAALFEQDFIGAKRRPLSKNYRSTPEIVNAFSQFSLSMKASTQSTALNLECHKPASACLPTFTEMANSESEIGAIATQIQETKKTGRSYRDQAVICRTNNRLNEIAEGLQARGIPVLHLGSLFERPEVRDFLALLSLVADKGGSGLMRVANFDDYRIPIADVRSFLDICKAQDQLPIDALHAAIGSAEFSSAGQQGFSKLREDLSDAERSIHPNLLVIRFLFDRGSYLRQMLADNSIETQLKAAALYQLLGALRSVSTFRQGLPIQNFLDRVRRLVLLNEERDLRQLPAAAIDIDAVRLITIHGAKGLEFPIVHLPMLMSGGIPKDYSGERNKPPAGMVVTPDYYPTDSGRFAHDEEQECLFFVAISRAEDELHLFRSQKQKSRPRKRSPYLDEIGPINERAIAEIERQFPIDDGTIGIGALEVPPTLEKDITMMSRCPRRYFYDRVCKLRTRKRDGPFVLTHSCIYAVIDTLKALQKGEQPTEQMLLDKLALVWEQKGPTEHGLEPEYRKLAEANIRTLAAHLENIPAAERDDLKLVLTNGEIILNPHYWGEFPDGTTVIRLIKTGRSISIGDQNVHASYDLAAQKRFGNGRYTIEVVQLGSEEVTAVKHRSDTFKKRVQRTDDLLADAVASRFPTNVEQPMCSGCPHFFICPAVPHIQ